MTAPRDIEPVADKVFDFLDAHLNEYEADEDDNPGKPPGSLGDFLVTFFQQFFEAGWKLEIKAIDQTAKRQVTDLRLKNKDAPKTTKLLFTAFEDLCDRWPDFVGFQYAGHRVEIERFHETYLPRLVRRIRAWAVAEGFGKLSARTEAALVRL